MKKVLFILAAVLSVAAVSCNKGEKDEVKCEFNINGKSCAYKDFSVVYDDSYGSVRIYLLEKPTDQTAAAAIFVEKGLLGKECALSNKFSGEHGEDYFDMWFSDGSLEGQYFSTDGDEFTGGSFLVQLDSTAKTLTVKVRGAEAAGAWKAATGNSVKADIFYAGPGTRDTEHSYVPVM